MEKIFNIFSSRTNGLMALKHGMQHQVLKFYQDCSFDDFVLTLTILRQGQISENANTLNFMESFEYFGLKVDNKSCLNEYTKIYE